MKHDTHIVITGASSGIGRALAKAFDQPGNCISLVARREGLLRELQAEIKTRSEVVVADLSHTDDPVGWLRQAEAALGPTDVLVNNAGVSFIEPVQSIDAKRIAWKFQINLHTPIAAMHHVMDHMLAQRSGAMVNVCSVAAFSPRAYMGHYSATKAGLASFSEALRMEFKDTGVHVLTVYPGPVETPMAERNWKQFKDAKKMEKLAPTGNTDTLARLILKAIKKKSARVIYPGFYKLGWWSNPLNYFVNERAKLSITGQKTPTMGGTKELEG